MPAIGSVKLKTFVPDGGESYSVKLTEALPPGPQFTVQGFFWPLQEARTRAEARTRNQTMLREFMRTPTRNRSGPSGQGGQTGIPKDTLAHGRQGGRGKRRWCPSANVRPKLDRRRERSGPCGIVAGTLLRKAPSEARPWSNESAVRNPRKPLGTRNLCANGCMCP